jgi:hypothetical protein
MRVVYSQDNCPGCVSLINEYNEVNGFLEGQDYRVVKLGEDMPVKDFLEKFPGVRTVPYVVMEPDYD